MLDIVEAYARALALAGRLKDGSQMYECMTLVLMLAKPLTPAQIEAGKLRAEQL